MNSLNPSLFDQPWRVKSAGDVPGELEFHGLLVDGRYILLDVNSSTLYEVDKPAMALFGRWTELPLPEAMTSLADKYGKECLERARETVEQIARRSHTQLTSSSEPKNLHQMHITCLQLHLSHRCNMSCRYCYEHNIPTWNLERVMSMDVAGAALDFLLAQLPEGREGTINLIGGEPLLHLDLIKDIVSYGRKSTLGSTKRLRFSVITNGTLLKNTRVVNFLLSEGIGVGAITIDGAPDVHDAGRPLPDGQSSYHRVLEGLLNYKQVSGHPVTVSSTIHHDNLNIVSTAQSFYSLGLRYMLFQTDFAHQDGFKLDAADLKKLMSEFEALGDFVIERARQGDQVPVIREFQVLGLDRKEKRSYRCAAGRDRLGVNAAGEIFPCLVFMGQEECKMGDVFTGLKCLYDIPVDSIAPCSKCWARYLCGGTCLYENYTSNGNMGSAYTEKCELYRKIVEVGIRVYVNRSKGKGKRSIEKSATSE